MYEEHRRWHPLTLAVVIAAGIVLGGIVLNTALWLLGLVAGLVVTLLKLGVLVGLAMGAVWCARLVFRDRQRA
jgi:hypothetical protein